MLTSEPTVCGAGAGLHLGGLAECARHVPVQVARGSRGQQVVQEVRGEPRVRRAVGAAERWKRRRWRRRRRGSVTQLRGLHVNSISLHLQHEPSLTLMFRTTSGQISTEHILFLCIESLWM